MDYFKSIIRADQYFSKHPEELEKYHIILKGNQNVQRCCFDGDVELDRKVWNLRENIAKLFSVNKLQHHNIIKKDIIFLAGLMKKIIIRKSCFRPVSGFSHLHERIGIRNDILYN